MYKILKKYRRKMKWKEYFKFQIAAYKAAYFFFFYNFQHNMRLHWLNLADECIVALIKFSK